MKKKIPKVTCIVPAFNEGKTIAKVLQTALSSALVDEVIVVDDGSTDKTFELADSQKVKVIRHPNNRGYGASLKTGIKEAGYEWILITDGDGTYPVDQIPSLLRFIPKYDMVVGARVGDNVHIPFIRRPAKWFLTKLAGFLAARKIPDLNSGLRVFRKDLSLEFSHLYPAPVQLVLAHLLVDTIHQKRIRAEDKPAIH